MKKAENSKKTEHSHLVSQFAVERYKFILNQIHSLNENFYKYISLFQTLATTIMGVIISFFVSWKNFQISPVVAIAGIRGLLGLLMLLSLFVILLLISGVFSWIDYRKEEVELLSQLHELAFRKAPSLKNFWRWHEAYLLIFIVIFNVVALFVAESYLIPLIK